MSTVAIGTRIPDETTCTWDGVRGYAIYLHRDMYYVTHEKIVQGYYFSSEDAAKAYSDLAWPVVQPDPAYASVMEYLNRLRKEMWAMSGLNEADLGEVTVRENHPSLGYQPAAWQKAYYGGIVEDFVKDVTGIKRVGGGRAFGRRHDENYRQRLMMMGRRPGKNFVVTGVDESGKLQFSSLPALMRDALNEEEDDNPYISEEVLREKMQGEKIRGIEFDEAVFDVQLDLKPNEPEEGVFHRNWLHVLPTSIKGEYTSEGSVQKLVDALTGSSYEYVPVKNADGNIVSYTHTFSNFLPPSSFWYTPSSLAKKPILKRGHKSGRKHPYRTRRDRARYQAR